MKKLLVLAVVLVLVGAAQALAQTARTVVNCVPGEYYCIGTSGDDVVTGSIGQDVIFGLEGDDAISTPDGRDFVFCGPGVDQMPVVLPDDELREQQGFLQYAPGSTLPELGFVAEDCDPSPSRRTRH